MSLILLIEFSFNILSAHDQLVAVLNPRTPLPKSGFSNFLRRLELQCDFSNTNDFLGIALFVISRTN